MISAQGLEDLSNAIQAQGYDPETADDYAVLIGDTPNFDDAGNLFIYGRRGKLLATLDFNMIKDHLAAVRNAQRNDPRPDGSA